MDISIDEKRVYDASDGPTPVYVVGEFGVARVDTSADLVGEFGLVHQDSARDASGRDGRVAIATAEDVLVGVSKTDETEFEALGVGPAVAVGFDGEELLVALEDESVLRGDGSQWTELGELAAVRAIDGDLLAAGSGVYQAGNDGLRHVGLEDARDVSAAGVPLAATAGGLYRLGNGWMDELDGEFRAVSAVPAGADAGEDARALGWAHAAGEDGLFAFEGQFAAEDSEWREAKLPVEGEVVAVDHREGVSSDSRGAYAVTADGTFLLSVGDGWNHQVLGLRGVTAVAAP